MLSHLTDEELLANVIARTGLTDLELELSTRLAAALDAIAELSYVSGGCPACAPD